MRRDSKRQPNDSCHRPASASIQRRHDRQDRGRLICISSVRELKSVREQCGNPTLKLGWGYEFKIDEWRQNNPKKNPNGNELNKVLGV